MEYHIHRLKEGEKTVGYRFMNSASLNKLGFWPPDPDAYEEIWQGTIHGADHNRILYQLYAKFNVDMPMLFRSRHYSMSVGDIVVLTDSDKTTTTYFCDSIGWTKLPQEFFTPVPAAE